MLARIIFFSAVISAILVVILLAIFSTAPENDASETLVSFSLYVQQPHVRTSTGYYHRQRQEEVTLDARGAALIFHRSLTEGPEATSRVVGKAQGFIIPHEQFARSDFNVIYLTFETPEYSGTLSVQAKDIEHKDEEVLTVVGGTGAFAFARGVAVFDWRNHGVENTDDMVSTYRVKLQLRFPDRSQTIPG